MFGDPALFPFDSYYINLIFAVPFRDMNSTIIPSFDKTFRSNWKADIDTSTINPSDIRITNDTTGRFIGPTKAQYLFPAPSNIANETGKIVPNGNFTFLNVHIILHRNPFIFALIFPLMGIPFLIGTMFILESQKGKDLLLVRVTITVILFAFIPIVNQMKPLFTLFNSITIFHFIVSIIMISTITFTISSIVTEFFMKKYQRFALWIDVLAFLFVISFIVSLTVIYPYETRIWFIPFVLIMIFGLGYGLLFRTAKLLWSIRS